ncbi:MAG: hypothetical protein F6K47_37980, partial [Symploca sp. SIO2E6]|nr:hypothetical protein [Symploca sp. SIO2E6]
MNNLQKVLENFIDKNQDKKTVENSSIVISQVTYWTNKEPDLTDIILKLILENNFHVLDSEEEDKVEYFVQNYIIKNWRNGAASQHLKTICHQIIRHQQKTKVLLKLYQVLSSEKVQTDDTLEVKALLQSNLLVTEHGQLKVHNPIYKAVFSKEWVEEELESVNKLQPSPRDIEKNQTTDKFNIIN